MGWLGERTGVSAAAVRERMARRVAPGSAAPVVTGSALVVLVLTQALSGSLLAMYYTPAWDRAHASVESIVTAIPLGWLVRSVHLWGAHLILLVGLAHLVRTFWREEYRAPCELTWIVKVVLLAIAAGLAITGQVLPLDVEGYGGALVAGSMGDAVGAGKIVRGGADPGDFMLGRFFAAHVLWLPAAGLALLAGHLAMAARGAAAEVQAGPTTLECVGFSALGTLAALATLAVLAPAGLGPPANPLAFQEERPLWFFLPAYQALKFLPAAAVLAGGAVLFGGALALPFVAKRWIRVAGGLALAVALLAGAAGALSNRTVAGIRFDNHAIPHRAP